MDRYRCRISIMRSVISIMLCVFAYLFMHAHFDVSNLFISLSQVSLDHQCWSGPQGTGVFASLCIRRTEPGSVPCWPSRKRAQQRRSLSRVVVISLSSVLLNHPPTRPPELAGPPHKLRGQFRIRFAFPAEATRGNLVVYLRYSGFTYLQALPAELIIFLT